MANQTDYKKISVSLIATVFNEQEHIVELLESYRQQTFLAKEFIIIDAFSTDQSYRLIRSFAQKYPALKIKLFRKKSNRSQARNFAVAKAQAQYLAFTDAGCVLDAHWLEELLAELVSSKTKVVGGFFQGLAHSRLEQAVVPYFLQLNKHLTAKNFIPTTRSLLMEKKLWQNLGGLNEKLEFSEDYQLMIRLKKQGIKIAFAPKAIVFWYPPHNLSVFLQKISAFAESDIKAGILRPKVITIFGRYLILFFIWGFNFYLFLVFLSCYLLWSIVKNLHNCSQAWYYLPLLQITSDWAIMGATIKAMPNFNSKAV